MDQFEKQVLNAHVGLTNVIEQDIIDTTLKDTFEDINNTLSDHCGPYGKYVMLTPTADRPLDEPTFTKDGISIVKSIEYASIMQRYVKNTIAYIGERVEKAGGDGTTSSMIITAQVLNDMRAIVKKNTLTYNEAMSIYNTFGDLVETELKQDAIITDDDSNKEHIYAVAYNQAMTSSHGDKKLSRIVATMFKKMPRKSWNHIVFECKHRETDNIFSLNTDDSDYCCNATPYDNKQYNNEADDGYSAEHAKLIITPLGIVLNSQDYITILNEMKEAIKENKPLCVIIPEQTDSSARVSVDEILKDDKNKMVTIYSVRTKGNTRINDLFGLVSTLGSFMDKLNDAPMIIEDVGIKFENDTIYISNAVKKTEDKTHPDSGDVLTPAGAYLSYLNSCLEEIKSNKEWRNVELEKTINRIYNTIHLQHIETLVIGGKAYDIKAAIPVVEDTLKATRAALRSGCILGCFVSLRTACKNIAETHHDHITVEIANCFINAIDVVSTATIKHAPKKIRGNSKDSLLKTAKKEDGCLNVLTGEISFISDILELKKQVITQPLIVDTALIRRFGEVAMKFIFTNRVIVPNGIVVEDSQLK